MCTVLHCGNKQLNWQGADKQQTKQKDEDKKEMMKKRNTNYSKLYTVPVIPVTKDDL